MTSRVLVLTEIAENSVPTTANPTVLRKMMVNNSQIWGWLKILIVFDIIFLIVALLTFEYIIEE